MNIVVLMIPMALFLGLGFVAAFLWAVDHEQFEDTDTPAYRILENEHPERNSNEGAH